MFSVVYIDIHNSKEDFSSSNDMGILSEKSPGSALFWVRVFISLSLYGYEF